MDQSTTALREIPLSALRNKTRDAISDLLNPCKILPSPTGYPRDYRGLAYLTNVPLPACKCPDPSEAVIKSWEKAKNPNVSEFIDALQQLDRWDIIDDIKPFVDEDILEYSRRINGSEISNAVVSNDSDKNIITIDDVRRIESGLEPQYYDAFLLYSDEDSEFAVQMVERLEQRHNLKLCLKDRDLVGGTVFEHEAIMRLISERCRRLIIIVSPSFIESSANKFFVTYAQALGIEQRQRKIVPCLYKRVTLPPELNYYFVLDYTRSSPFWDFWDKLSQSVKSPPQITDAARAKPSISITELPPEPLPLKPSEWDCPKKVPSSAPSSCLAIEAAPPPPCAEPSPISSSPITTPTLVKKKKKSKITSFLSGRLPTPPSESPSKKSWFKKKKEKVLVDSS